jgi:hypothetical protein
VHIAAEAEAEQTDIAVVDTAAEAEKLGPHRTTRPETRETATQAPLAQHVSLDPTHIQAV